MHLFKSIIIAISMFSKIPVPTLKWEKEDMKYSLAAFPLIGVIIGVLCFLWYKLMLHFEFSNLIMSVGLLLIPIIITGGLHLDGFCDTSDALASRAPMEKKLEILKDPRIGAFGVINLAIYLIAYFVFILEFPKTDAFVICFSFSFLLSRALSGLSLVLFRISSESSIGKAFATPASKMICRAIFVSLVLVSSIIIIYFGGFAGMAAIIIAAFSFIIFKMKVINQFGGTSGDLTGWFVQVVELIIPLTIVFAHHIIGVLI